MPDPNYTACDGNKRHTRPTMVSHLQALVPAGEGPMWARQVWDWIHPFQWTSSGRAVYRGWEQQASLGTGQAPLSNVA